MRSSAAPTLARSRSPSTVCAAINSAVAPSVAPTTVAAVPNQSPKKNPPDMVATAPTGSEKAITTT